MDLNQAILDTLCYADIFNYPLTRTEIWEWLLTEKKIKKSQINKKKYKLILGQMLNYHLNEVNGFICFKGKEATIKDRIKREKKSIKKFSIARSIAKKLKFIPTIQLIGVSGTLAWRNTESGDDIDLFIVTKRGFMWITRFLTILLVELFAKRRRPQTIKRYNNLICLNMFVDGNNLAIEHKDRNIYTAHDVARLQPIFDRNKTFAKFLSNNMWIRSFLPHFKRQSLMKNDYQQQKYHFFWRIIFYPLEILLKYLQLWYMQPKRTKEKISDGILRFHPVDAKDWVMKKYLANKKKYPKLPS